MVSLVTQLFLMIWRGPYYLLTRTKIITIDRRGKYLADTWVEVKALLFISPLADFKDSGNTKATM